MKDRSKEKSNKDFIENLSQELQPIHVNWSPESRAILWISFNLFFTFLLMQIIGSFSLNHHLKDWRIAEFVFGLFTIISLGYTSFLGIIPGAFSKNKFKFAIAMLVFLLSFFAYIKVAGLTPPEKGIYRWYCNLEILLLSLVPGLQMVYFLYKDRLVVSRHSLVFSGIVSSLIPAFYMNYICDFDPKHVFMHHFGPMALFTLIFAVIMIKVNKKGH